ncbi:hypothetical protein L211DRAFT_841354, partial [Terfezia boudieri ATCC MYA-4762]
VLTRHARAHCYVNAGHGNVGTVIIHNAIKDTSTSDYSQCHQEALSVNIAAQVQKVSGGRLPPT